MLCDPNIVCNKTSIVQYKSQLTAYLSLVRGCAGPGCRLRPLTLLIFNITIFNIGWKYPGIFRNTPFAVQYLPWSSVSKGQCWGCGLWMDIKRHIKIRLQWRQWMHLIYHTTPQKLPRSLRSLIPPTKESLPQMFDHLSLCNCLVEWSNCYAAGVMLGNGPSFYDQLTNLCLIFILHWCRICYVTDWTYLWWKIPQTDGN